MVLLSGKTQISSIAEIIAMLIVFILILVAAYFVTKYFGKTMSASGTGGNMKVLETVRLAPDKYLQIVEVTGRYFLLAVTKGNISTVAELNKKDMKLISEDASNERSKFKELLQKAIKK